MGASASSSNHQTSGTSSTELDPALLRPRRMPRQPIVNLKKVEKLIKRKKLAPF